MPLTLKLSIWFLVFTGVVCCNTKKEVFEKDNSSESGKRFKNIPIENDELNAFYFANYYNGGGVASGDINNDGLPDIYFTANSKQSNKLYLNKGNFEFEDITAKAGVAGTSDWCTGVTMADVNGDGFLDIYVCAVANKLGLTGRNELFINNGNGTFIEKAQEYGLAISAYSSQSAFFDFDKDGDLDCFVLNQSDKHNARIVDTAARKNFDPNAGDYLLQNDLNSTGTFTDISKNANIYQSSIGYGLGLAIADINNDGWDDIYIGNDFHENDYYYINKGNGTFSESGAEHFNHYSRFSMGNDIADYDNDGQLDIITVDMLPADEKILKTYGSDERIDIYNYKIIGNGYQHQYSRNCLQHNLGNGTQFSDVALTAGVAATDWSWSALMTDFNNDGNKDIFITSGILKRTADLDYAKFRNEAGGAGPSGRLDRKLLDKIPDGKSHCFMYEGSGTGSFVDRSNDWDLATSKGYFNGASYADLDNDGDVDVVVNALHGEALLLRNNSARRNYLKLKFQGDSLNLFGTGTKAYLFSGKKVQYQQLMPTRGFQSSVEPILHFGVDSASTIDSLLIVWPDQKFQLIKSVKANNSLSVNYNNAAGKFEYYSFFLGKKELLEDVSALVKCDWKHKENNFVDFNSQYLIPHLQSTRGPALAVADVNRDGLDDFYIGGAKGQAGTLMIASAANQFTSIDTALFNLNKESEDVSAVFFDANGDGFVDLYVASGGNEYENGNPRLSDHLYINNGNGHFSEKTNAIPKLLVNKSAVIFADIDKDGDADLFVGVLADAKKYGAPQTSYLLINDGKGTFSVAGKKVISLNDIGIVTAAVFSDINNDTWPDLVVSGEWMPLKIYFNNKGVFELKDIPASTGLWQCLYASDVNGDGNADLLAGNWGLNTKLWSGKNGPVKLYVKDFDKNGSVEQIMCYTINGKEYNFLPKDELEQTIPVLKKAYLTYSEVAGKTVDYLFYDLFKDYTELKAEVLASSCFIGDGKGGFTRVDLPLDLQMAPLFAISPAANESFIGAGNFYGVLPYEGRYDALYPTIFSYQKDQKQFKTEFIVAAVRGEVRNIKPIAGQQNHKTLMLVRNNDKIVFLR
ncbi:MAG: VCBS repeat-containing protein [Agriterribacter sp.]